MIKFSVSTQAFYNLELNYADLPNDLVEITAEQHQELLSVLNSGCVVFDNLTYSEPKPSQFHKWNGSSWVDNRTPEEIAQQQREAMPNLSPIEFEIKIYKAGLYDAVKNYIENEASVPMKIAYNRATFFGRTDSFIATAMLDLSLTDEQVDALWNA